MGLYEFLRYIVVKMLAGESNKVMALRDTVVNGDSPSVVARRYGLTKHQIRGFVLRVSDHGVPMWMARKILDLGWRHIVSIRPVIVQRGGIAYCTLCKRTVLLGGRDGAWKHIATHHSDLVDSLVIDLAHKIREELKARRVGA